MRQLARKSLETINLILEKTTSESDSFLGGKLGLLYYYFNFYKASNDADIKQKGEALLDSVFANIDAGYPNLIGASFSTGGAGLGYVVNSLLKERLISFEIEDSFSELDHFLFQTALSQIDKDFIDFLYGALGVVHYFTQRESSAEIDYYLDILVGRVCERVVKKDEGYWFRNDVLKVEEEGNINFGLSHGLSGVLLILMNAYQRSGHKDTIRTVVLEGIRFLRKYKMDVDFSNDEYSFFPFIVKPAETEIRAPNRLGWCYGDLGQVLLFYRSGNLYGRSDLIELANAIGGQTLMRKGRQATLVCDSSFCHGASGLSQFYRQLYRETKFPAYLDGYEYWIEQTILLLDEDIEKGVYAGKEHGVLDGLVGVALSLLSYVSERELTWSKSLLL